MSLDVYLTRMVETEVFGANVTHNLGEMAREADLYKVLWRPEELFVGDIVAEQLIPHLEHGLAELKKDPARFTKFNASNGYGDYHGLVAFVEDYLAGCKDNLSAKVNVSR